MTFRLTFAVVIAFLLTCSLSGCAVITVAAVAVDVAATGVGLAVDAAVGTAKLTGKAVGAVADAVAPDDKE